MLYIKLNPKTKVNFIEALLSAPTGPLSPSPAMIFSRISKVKLDPNAIWRIDDLKYSSRKGNGYIANWVLRNL